MDKLHDSGIQTIMLTGDQSATARAVARQIRLSDGEPEVIDSAELDRLSAAELGTVARRAHAFARISPGQKLRIVRACRTGAVVAMFGDGINDSSRSCVRPMSGSPSAAPRWYGEQLAKLRTYSLRPGDLGSAAGRH
jgi:high-affinity K+ transport system ATPase subunit B